MNTTLGFFKVAFVKIELTPKRDVMLVAPKSTKIRPTALWRSVPNRYTNRDIIEHLVARDGERFKRAGGVSWSY